MKKLLLILCLLAGAKAAEAQFTEYYILNSVYQAATTSLKVTTVGGASAIATSTANGFGVAISDTATAVATGITFRYVSGCNDGSSNEMIVRYDGTAATATSPVTNAIYVAPSECFGIYFQASSGINQTISIIASSGETTTARWFVSN